MKKEPFLQVSKRRNKAGWQERLLILLIFYVCFSSGVFEKSFSQIVTHILRKTFFKHALLFQMSYCLLCSR